MINDAIDIITKMLIEQDITERKTGKVEYLTLKKTDLLKICIKLLKKIKIN